MGRMAPHKRAITLLVLVISIVITFQFMWEDTISVADSVTQLEGSSRDNTTASGTGTAIGSRAALFQLVKDVHEVFDIFGVPYAIEFETLLGAVKCKGLLANAVTVHVAISQADEAKLFSRGTLWLLHELGYAIDGAAGTYRCE
jgi:hypothetical protein